MKNQLVKSLLQIKPLIRTITMSILFAFSIAAVAHETSMDQHKPIDNETASSQSNEQTAWVDVRSWLEYQIDHIDGDPRVPASDIVEGVSELYPDKNTPIRLYCAAGVRAGTASPVQPGRAHRRIGQGPWPA